MQVCGLRSQTDSANPTEGRAVHQPFGKSVLLPQSTCGIQQAYALFLNELPAFAVKVYSVPVDSSTA